MAWLAKLDAAATRWHWTAVAPYHAAKWALIALGAVCVIRLSLHRLGIWLLY